jgi:hypothetical protein
MNKAGSVEANDVRFDEGDKESELKYIGGVVVSK